MELDEYQETAKRTAPPPTAEVLAILTLGLAGEAGEVADLVKKHLGHGHEWDHDRVKKELGDVLWYVAVLANHCHMTLEEIAYANIEKLKLRYPEGFSEERSRNRGDK